MVFYLRPGIRVCGRGFPRVFVRRNVLMLAAPCFAAHFSGRLPQPFRVSLPYSPNTRTSSMPTPSLLPGRALAYIMGTRCLLVGTSARLLLRIFRHLVFTEPCAILVGAHPTMKVVVTLYLESTHDLRILALKCSEARAFGPSVLAMGALMARPASSTPDYLRLHDSGLCSERCIPLPVYGRLFVHRDGFLAGGRKHSCVRTQTAEGPLRGLCRPNFSRPWFVHSRWPLLAPWIGTLWWCDWREPQPWQNS